MAPLRRSEELLRASLDPRDERSPDRFLRPSSSMSEDEGECEREEIPESDPLNL